ncbi:hypothetical protein 16Q_033c [Pseudomonas phage 16Q]|nr:hypothetical protein 16Q_033c [Pseudomonas phage 16Q]
MFLVSEFCIGKVDCPKETPYEFNRLRRNLGLPFHASRKLRLHSASMCWRAFAQVLFIPLTGRRYALNRLDSACPVASSS